MKKYKFKIENITEKLIEIEAKDNQEAIKKLAGFMAKKDKKKFANELEEDKYCFIHIQEISKDKKHVLFADDDEINRDVISNLLALDEIDFEEIEEEDIKEHIEVICERCGNSILLDEIIHHLDS